MENRNSVWPAVLSVIAVIVLIGNVFALYTVAKQDNSVPSADDIAAKVANATAVQPVYNDTALSNKVDKLSNEVFEDDTWKADAKALATSEFSAKQYKDIFNFLESQNVSIVEKSDISSVVVKDSKVTSFDVEEQDATVVQELKVYFEDADGDKVKVYLDVETEIEDNDVVDQTFELV